MNIQTDTNMEKRDSQDLEKFLSKVDQLSELIKEMNSNDADTQQNAIGRADHLAIRWKEEKSCTNKINKTVINTNNATQEVSQCPDSLANFMKATEMDAMERRKRRKMKEKLANALKEKGNKAFANGDYEAAVRLYTEGVEQLRDMHLIFTNRAQAYIKLKKYKEAISDCEWALKCDDKCIKAYVHMGRAHLGLMNFAESRLCYKKILDIEPNREPMVKDYLTQVDLEEKKTVEENKAREQQKEGKGEARVVLDGLKFLQTADERNLDYPAVVTLLLPAIKDSTAQTLFRLNNGFSILADSSSVRSCLGQTSKEPYRKDVCVAVLSLWKQVCSGNEENQKVLLQCPNTREQIVGLLASQEVAVQQECLALLFMFCETQHGRRLVIENLSLHRLVEALMDCLSSNVTSGTTALTILKDLAGENKFLIQFRQKFVETFGHVFKQLMGNPFIEHLLQPFIFVLAALSLDNVIIKKMAGSEEFWSSSLAAMEWCARCQFQSPLYPLMTLMVSMASEHVPGMTEEHAVVGCSRCVDLLSDPDEGLILRATAFLYAVLPMWTAAARKAVQQGVVERLLKIVQVYQGTEQTCLKHAIRALAVCTACSLPACKELVKLDKGFTTMRELLRSSSNDMVVGNAALCMGHCFQVQEAATSLLGTDCVPLLLRHAAEDGKKDVQRNAAIALGKLCHAECRHVKQLAELHGFAVLKSCMKL